jgi:hypothetical protein
MKDNTHQWHVDPIYILHYWDIKLVNRSQPDQKALLYMLLHKVYWIPHSGLSKLIYINYLILQSRYQRTVMWNFSVEAVEFTGLVITWQTATKIICFARRYYIFKGPLSHYRTKT